MLRRALVPSTLQPSSSGSMATWMLLSATATAVRDNDMMQKVHALATQIRHVHGKPTTAHKKRTQHSRQWWLKAKARHLTARPHEEAPTRPHFAGYSEDVDRPMVVPQDASCFNCKKKVDTQTSYHNYVWIPAGNATIPTQQGYVFHKDCFKCWNCKFRIHHNKFYSKHGEAWCLECALGKEKKFPTRRWHTSFVNSDRTGSRMAGHFFPRHKHQVEFLFNPEE